MKKLFFTSLFLLSYQAYATAPQNIHVNVTVGDRVTHFEIKGTESNSVLQWESGKAKVELPLTSEDTKFLRAQAAEILVRVHKGSKKKCQRLSVALNIGGSQSAQGCFNGQTAGDKSLTRFADLLATMMVR